MAKSKGVIIQSVARAMDILEYFNKIKEMGISEISECMGLSKSTVFGLVNTLVNYGYLEQDSENKKYKLGIKLFELGCTVEKRLDLRNEARPFCEKISKAYGQTVHLATHYEGEVVYIDKFDMPDFPISYSQVGKRAPMSCTGVGKAMLAYLPWEYVQRFIVSKGFPLKTEKSIKTVEELKECLFEIRRNGYAIDDEEILIGLRCVAAPIFNHKNEPIAAISLSGMVNKMTDDVIKEMAKDIIDCTRAISNSLGCKKDN
ncbi:MAG: IclR family transcriptional regulator [Lachnospiraceae bacterium]|nr:IclR family transcriptional regulator [Lachnospiraceae bacterium]